MKLSSTFAVTVLTVLNAPSSAEDFTRTELAIPKEAEIAAVNSLPAFRQLVTAPNDPAIIADGPEAADVRLPGGSDPR